MPEPLDLQLQAAILQIGRMLTTKPHRTGSHSRSASPEELAAEVERVLSLVRASPARRIIGIKQNFITPHDTIRLKAIAIVAWEMVAEVTSSTCVETISAAIVDPTKPYCEQLLFARDVLGLLVVERRLTLSHGSGGWSGRLLLPPRVFSWIVGGSRTHGDFDPVKMESALPSKDGVDEGSTGLKRLPTARQLYEAVRKEVCGLDSELKVLASRFALHAIRAAALKAGADCTEVPQMVVVLIAESGVGKSFTVSRFSKHLGLGLCQYDSTVLTSQGFVGADLDEPYRLLVNSVGGDVDEGARGIIFLDEFSSKASRSHGGRDNARDVSTLAIQQELLCKLQANAPFVVGGKRQFDARPFLFDGRQTGYVLGGTFDGLDEVIGRMEGRRDIGFATEAGSKRHVRVQDALVEAGLIRAVVNRISTVVRLPTPSVQSVERGVVQAVNGFNEILLSQAVVLTPTEAAVRLIAGYAVESRGYYRAAKAVLATIVEGVLFDGRDAYVQISEPDVRTAIERMTSGVIEESETQPAAGGTEVLLDGDADGLPEQAAVG